MGGVIRDTLIMKYTDIQEGIYATVALPGIGLFRIEVYALPTS